MAKLRGFHAIGAFRPTSVKSGKSVQNHHCRHVSFSSSLSSAHPNANQMKRAKYSQMSISFIQAYWATFPQIAFVLFSSKKSQLHEAECTHGKRCISVNCHWFSFSSTQVPQWALQKAPHRRALQKAPPQKALCELPPQLFYGLLLQFSPDYLHSSWSLRFAQFKGDCLKRKWLCEIHPFNNVVIISWCDW